MKDKISYKIQWELLSEDEIDFLDKVGVERHPNGIDFTETPSWDDYCLIFAYLIGLEARTPQEGNHIAFAIGDCANAGYKIFGQEKVESWYEDFFKLRAIRDYTLNVAGGTLIYLQHVEQQVKLCCAFLQLKGLNLTLIDFFSDDPKHRRQTLGQLASALKKSELFKPEFEEKLSRFVQLRNDFVHNIWAEKWQQQSNKSGLPSEEELLEIKDFIISLLREAKYVRNVFRGLLYQIMPPSTKGEIEKPNPFSSWAKYIPMFQDAIRNDIILEDEENT